MIQFVRNDNNAVAVQRGALKGDDGGYYIPSVNEEGQLTWTPSAEDMPAVEGAIIKGADGKPGLYVGTTEPTDGSLVWLNPNGVASEEVVTKEDVDKAIEAIEIPSVEGLASEEYVNEAIAGIKHPEPDLSAYATKKELEEALAAIIDGEEVSY